MTAAIRSVILSVMLTESNSVIRGMNIPHVRKVNSNAVLEALRTGGQMGRREISKLTHLSFPTVCRVVNQLMERSIVTEVASVSLGNAKRKTVLLDINPRGGWIVAVDIGSTRIRAAAMDISGALHEFVQAPLENVRGEESVAPAIVSVLTEIIGKCEPKRGAPLAIGISSTGMVDSDLGVVKLSFNLQLRDFPIAKIVQQVWNAPVVVNNDVTAATLAEAKFGQGREHSDFAYVSVGTGIGAGLVFDGQVHQLHPNAEFGLMVVAPEGDPERFSGRGYLESVASGRGIAAAARKEIEAGTKSLLTELAPDGPASITAKVVSEAARRGDVLARDVLARAANYLGIGIVNLAHTLGLTFFVISGGVSRAGDAFWDPLRESVDKYEYWPGMIQLAPSLIKEKSSLLGAGILALDTALDSME